MSLKNLSGIIGRPGRKNMQTQTASQVVLDANGVCQCCRRETHPDDMRLAHVMPPSRGGPSDTWNLWAVCRWCQRSKGTTHPAVWFGRLGRKPPPDFMREFRKRFPADAALLARAVRKPRLDARR